MLLVKKIFAFVVCTTDNAKFVFPKTIFIGEIGSGTAEQLRDWGEGGGALLVTQYWGGTRHFFLLNLYNFQNIGGGGRARAPLLRGPCGSFTQLTGKTDRDGWQMRNASVDVLF